MNELLGLATSEQFAAYSIHAEDLALSVIVKQTLPEAGANFEGVVQVSRRNIDVGVHEEVPGRHQQSPMSRRLA